MPPRCLTMIRLAAAFALLAVFTLPLRAADERVLFGGGRLDDWTNAGGQEPGTGWVVQAGAMVLKSPKAGGDIWTRDRFGDFVLELDFKTTGNSGIFIRTDKPRDCVQTGIEIQVIPPEGKADRHSVGAIYDLVAPSKTNAKKDDWNAVKITAKGPTVTVEINGEKVNSIDLNQWNKPGLNPDGSKNKFKAALKDFKREGHIGFQDHGAVVSYRNVRIRPL